MSLARMSLAWFEDAACRGVTELMFPQGHKDVSYIKGARTVCRGCPVRDQCKDYALSFPAADMHGVWAGMTPRQLAAEQKRLGVRPTQPTLAAIFAALHADL